MLAPQHTRAGFGDPVLGQFPVAQAQKPAHRPCRVLILRVILSWSMALTPFLSLPQGMLSLTTTDGSSRLLTETMILPSATVR